MTTLFFDTLQYAKRAQDAGFSKTQAEFQAYELATMHAENATKLTRVENYTRNLATKTDLEDLKLATKTDLEDLKLATKTDLENLKKALTTHITAVMTIRLGSMLAAAVLILPVLLKLIQLV